jgi:hypothetical protein
MENAQQKSFVAQKSAAEPAFFWHNSDAAFSSLVDGRTRTYDIYESASRRPHMRVKPAESWARLRIKP